MDNKARWLYIIENPAFPGFYKIGISVDLSCRLSSYNTGCPQRNYKILYSIFHPDGVTAEKRLKDAIKMFSLETKGEWHKIDLGVAKARLDEQLDDYTNFPKDWK